jgi:S1-C subfamily serine protease
VIISPDGLIVTNNHVISDAEEIKITLDNRTAFTAEVLGTDPTTDLALLRINANELPHLTFGNSDNVAIGEWVLAIGNPYELTSTVTAGIVSAKARSINILRSQDRLSIESFIQTDAVVNPGNSGGALIDTEGNLIGINTAIATRTGSYNGYSFAVPSNLVFKVVSDLKDFGEVKRALLGIAIQDVSAELAERFGLNNTQGVLIADITTDSGADKADLQVGDIVVSIDGIETNSVSSLQERVAIKRPGDVVNVGFKRDNNFMNAQVTLGGVDQKP